MKKAFYTNESVNCFENEKLKKKKKKIINTGYRVML